MAKVLMILIGLLIIVVLFIGLFSKDIFLSPFRKLTEQSKAKLSGATLPISCIAPNEKAQQLLNTINAGKNS